jgi:beta-phosphoglucomutase-like phosphatase (HAD superfamily)
MKFQQNCWRAMGDDVPRLYVLLLLFVCCYDSCTGFCCRLGSSISQGQERIVKHGRAQYPSLLMVRNIDLPEALIFYGLSSAVDDSTGEPRDGLEAILLECAEIKTAAVLLVQEHEDTTILTRIRRPASFTAIKRQQVPAPNPFDLLDCVQSITVQPRPFGGSSGFGSKPADPERNPLPRYCVAFTTTIDQTRAARAAGMRVIAVENFSMDDDQDDILADAIIGSYEEINGLDDIATPGSFWLNPPHPRDDEGNSVDPEWLASYASSEEKVGQNVPDEMDDEDFKAILADIAPLR